MKRRWPRAGVLVAVVAGLALVLWWLRPGGETPAPPPARPRLGAPARPITPAPLPGELSGQVVDPDGRPVAGALVTLTSGKARSLTVRTHRTGPGGSFRFERLAAGGYMVDARAMGFTTAFRGPIVLEAGDLEDVTLKLWSGGVTLSGRVLDAGGGVIPGARVRSTSYARSADETHEGRMFHTLSDAEGHYRLQLPPARHKLQVDADGYAGTTESRELRADQTRDFVLQPGARISGRVLTMDGREPVAGAQVSAPRADRPRDLTPPTTTSDDRGGFVLAPLPPGAYRVVARKEGLLGAFGPAVNLGATEGADDVEVLIAPTVSVQGRVSAAGKPVANARIALWPLDRERRHLAPDWKFTEPDGRYRVDGVLPGSYRLGVSGAGHASHAEPLSLGAAVQRDVILQTPSDLRGIVLTSEGKPAAQAWVRAVLEAADPARTVQAQRVTDSEGRFTIGNLGGGELTVTATHQFEAATIGPERLEGGRRKDVTLHLAEGASIAGVARWDDATPIAAENVMVVVEAFESSHMRMGVRTAPDGSFTIRGLPPGEISLLLDPRGRDRSRLDGPGSGRTTVTLKPGEHMTGVELVVMRR